eukprot:5432967-Pyramimonas_sp.AAC.1
MQEAQVYSHGGPIRCRKRRSILRGIKNRGHQKKGTPTGVVNRAQGPSYWAAGRTGLRASLY